MSRKHLILCGGAAAPAGRAWSQVPRVVLDAPQPGDGNVHLRVDDIVGAMAADLPDVMADLVELATYVYCADQAVGRGGKAEFEYGAKWRRRFRFQVPVRQPDFWNGASLREELARTLGFLSDDDYEFEFVRRSGAPVFDRYLWGAKGPRRGEVDTVMLFSGGLDSLAGAVEEVFTHERRVALVSHRPVGKIDKRQQDLVALLGQRARERGKPQPFHVPVWVNKDKVLGREYTQRTRSFLFGCIGVAVARLFGLDVVRFYENGVVSLNLPVCAQVLGGRASRTTHPQVLWRMQSLISKVLERSIRLENPFLWRTKTEVTAGVRNAGLGEMVANTVSCTHTWEVTVEQPHCGKCSQCIDRRLAAVAAGLTDLEDPAQRYRTAVLTGGFQSVEHQTMVERVVGMALHVGRMTNPVQLFSAFGEASRVVRYVPNTSADDAAEKMSELWQRQARQVESAIDTARALSASSLHAANNCLLGIVGVATQGGAVPEGEGEQLSDFTLDKFDLKILTALATVDIACMVKQIAGRAVVSRKTVGKRLPDLVRRRYVKMIAGERSGYAITKLGRKTLADFSGNRSAA